MKKQSQNQKILDYLKKGYSITPLEAWRKFKCLRLAARISDLRGMGVPIYTEMLYRKDSKNARYSISELAQ